MRLGEIIRALKLHDASQNVYYDFGRIVPSGLRSSRGNYSELALGWAVPTWDKPAEITVGELLKLLEDAIGKTYEGYKGGDYIMDENTPVHVDNWGEWTSTRLRHVSSTGYSVILETQADLD